MFKILYAASNNVNSKIQLTRFIDAIKIYPIKLKIAAYKNYSPDISIDWTLDSLININRPNTVHFDNENFQIYFNQIKYYNPDLIISDLEYFTSYAANLLNITLWQCSSSIINFALSKKEKYNLGLFKNYSFIFNKTSQEVQRKINILDNSNSKFIYSHFGETKMPPDIHSDYEWIRPYHQVGKHSINCQHNIVAATIFSNKKIINYLKPLNDVVIFTEHDNEYYPNIKIKNIYDTSEYFCNLKNSNNFVCEGNISFLADAFYNNKRSIIITNLQDPECIINSVVSSRLGLSSDIDFSTYKELDEVNTNTKVKFLHEKVLEYF